MPRLQIIQHPSNKRRWQIDLLMAMHFPWHPSILRAMETDAACLINHIPGEIDFNFIPSLICCYPLVRGHCPTYCSRLLSRMKSSSCLFRYVYFGQISVSFLTKYGNIISIRLWALVWRLHALDHFNSGSLDANKAITSNFIFMRSL